MSPLCTRELKSTKSLAIVPDTCDPTCTVMTALIVPVASTTSWMSPRSTLAVKCCAGMPRFSTKAKNSTAATKTPARMSHLLFVCAYRHANPDCPRALRHGNEHHIHNPDSADD